MSENDTLIVRVSRIKNLPLRRAVIALAYPLLTALHLLVFLPVGIARAVWSGQVTLFTSAAKAWRA